MKSRLSATAFRRMREMESAIISAVAPKLRGTIDTIYPTVFEHAGASSIYAAPLTFSMADCGLRRPATSSKLVDMMGGN